MTLVANTGPLIALAKIDRLDLLTALASEVRVPDRVLHEVLAKPGADSKRLQAIVGVSVRAMPPPADPPLEDTLATRHLDDGFCWHGLSLRLRLC